MQRSNRARSSVGALLLLTGGAWMLDNVTDIDVPWEWVLPVILVVAGLGLMLGGNGPTTPPSQFERDDTPRVP